MEPNGPKLSIWTEGLDAGWKSVENREEQVDRGTMGIPEATQLVDQIWAFNGEQVDCTICMQYKSVQLNLKLEFGKILASDPQDMNYHGVEIIPSELQSYLEGHFEINLEEEDLGSHPIRVIEWCVLGTFLLILGFSLFYMNRFLSADSGFLPLPQAVEFDRPTGQEYIQQYSGIYTTQIRDGGMAIELKPDGTFGYYDLAKAGPVNFNMVGVNIGQYRPVLIHGRLTLLTDNRFRFIPMNQGEMEFLQRKFNKVADARDDVPYLKFPE